MTLHHIRTIMRTEYPVLSPGMPIRRAVAMLVEARAAAAPVVGDDNGIVGILTQKDCFRPALHASYYREWTGQVADYMTREVFSVDAEEELIAVAEMFLNRSHRVFPVTDGTELVGIVYRSDVLARLMELG